MKYKLKPYIFVFRLTERCEVGCPHCSVSALRRGDDSNLDVLVDAIAELSDYGIGRLHLTGGEPLLFGPIDQVVAAARNAHLVVGCTSSAFTRKGETAVERLDELAERDVSYVMLSYDDDHAGSVSQSSFIDFVERSVEKNIEVAVFTVESSDSVVTSESLKQACIDRGIPVERIDWSASDLSYVGRGEHFVEDLAGTAPIDAAYPRCPIVLSAPTLNPDGSVSLCNCARFDAPKFTIGHYPDESLATIIDRMRDNPIYRLLAKLGPQEALRQANLPVNDDMCGACEQYLKACDDNRFERWVVEHAKEVGIDTIEVDYVGLPAMYQRYLQERGERLET